MTRERARRAGSRARAVAAAAVAATLVVASGCRIADLLTPVDEPEPAIVVSADPSAIRDSAVAGRSRGTTIRVLLSSEEGEWRWRATERTGSSWLRLGLREGTLPGPVEVTLVPDDLDPGTYQDTLDFAFPDDDTLVLSLPVSYRILRDDRDDDDGDGDGTATDDCPTIPLVIGRLTVGSLDPDCPSPLRQGHFASLYSLDGGRDERLTFRVEGAGFDPRLTVYVGAPDADSVFAESVRCDGSSVDVCITDRALPRTGPYTVEVSSKKKGEKGMFFLRVIDAS